MKQNKIFISLAFLFSALSVNVSYAQTVILDESLMTQSSFNKFIAVSVTGSHTWYFSSLYGACMSGYTNPNSYENEDWFISPELYLSAMNNVKLTFDHTRGSAPVMNVGMSEGWYKVFATADYTGNPATTQWIELEGVIHATTAWQFVSSGELIIPAVAKSANTRIAFRYLSSNTESATWEIKNVRVTGEPVSGNEDGVFKITTWNTEWLGCTGFGPTDEDLQIKNVAAGMRIINSDIYCLQEVSNTAAFPSINTLVSLLGSDEWGGNIVPGNTGDCFQRQAVIYKKSKVQFVNSSELSNGINAQGNTYYYNWSSGRYPALYNVNLLAGSIIIPVSLVNIHAKAFSEEENYIRRKGASEGLKAILDGSQYNTRNIIIIGDFNDYLIGSTCVACGDSPYKNFIDDAGSYRGLTQNLQDEGCSYYPRVVDNMIISNELFDKYVANSTAQESTFTQSIPYYCYTTSTHLPVSALFKFSVTNGIDNIVYSKNENTLLIYPNPVKNELFVYSETDVDNFTIFDLSGKQLLSGKLNGKSIHVDVLSAGVYILRIGNCWGRFLKE